MKTSYDFHKENYDADLAIHKLSHGPVKKKPSLFSKAYGYLLLFVFMVSVSALDSLSFIPTVVLAITIMLGSIYLYLGGHFDGE